MNPEEKASMKDRMANEYRRRVDMVVTDWLNSDVLHELAGHGLVELNPTDQTAFRLTPLGGRVARAMLIALGVELDARLGDGPTGDRLAEALSCVVASQLQIDVFDGVAAEMERERFEADPKTYAQSTEKVLVAKKKDEFDTLPKTGTEMKCAKCGVELWISPASLIAVRDGASAYCAPCAEAQLNGRSHFVSTASMYREIVEDG